MASCPPPMLSPRLWEHGEARPKPRRSGVLELVQRPRPLGVWGMRRLRLVVGLVVQHLGLELRWVEEELDQPRWLRLGRLHRALQAGICALQHLAEVALPPEAGFSPRPGPHRMSGSLLRLPRSARPVLQRQPNEIHTRCKKSRCPDLPAGNWDK